MCGHFKDSHFGEKSKSRIAAGVKPKKCLVKRCKFDPKGQARLLSDHLKLKVEHEPEELLEVGYEAQYLYEINSDKSQRVIEWLLTRGFIVLDPNYKHRKPA